MIISKRLEQFCLEVIEGKRRGILPFFVKIILRFISWIYRFVSACRNWAYDQGWVRRYSPPVPVVVSVGNIVAGGTGKTPVTLMIAKELIEEFSLAILTRGYRSPAEHLAAPIILNTGEGGPLYPASYCGDEPYLLALNVPKAWIFVGKNREKASTIAAKVGARVIVLDDGMQYRGLNRDFEIVVIDAGDPFGKGYFLPRGFLRENVKALNRASILVVNHVRDRAQYLKMKHKIARYSNAPIVATHPILAGIYDLQGNEIDTLQGKRVGLFCGIARPDYFRHMIQMQKAVIVAEKISIDHVAPNAQSLHLFAEECQRLGAEYLVCTEKDKVKLGELRNCPLPIVWLQMQLCLVEGHEHWNSFLAQIKEKLGKDASAIL